MDFFAPIRVHSFNWSLMWSGTTLILWDGNVLNGSITFSRPFLWVTYPKKSPPKKWKMMCGKDVVVPLNVTHTIFFNFCVFPSLKNSKMMNGGIFIRRCRIFLGCQKNAPSCWGIDHGDRGPCEARAGTLDRLERSQNCILLSPFAMQFLSTFLSKMPRFVQKKKL